jgi:fatty acid desaturase
MSWYLNRLNYHSVHHAFPKVPFYNLKIAHHRFMELYQKSAPMVLEHGYLGTTLRLATHPTVIGRQIASTQKGQKQMIAI